MLARRRIYCLLGTLLASSAQVRSGLAEDGTPPSPVGTVQTPPALQTDKDDDQGPNFVALPFPITNGAIGNGAAVVGALLYKFDDASQGSSTGLGGFYTQSNSYAFGVQQKANFDEDRYHFRFEGAYYSVNYGFYGVGQQAGAAGQSIPLHQYGYGIIPEFLFRIAPHIYIGPRFRYITATSSVDLSAIETRFHLDLSHQLAVKTAGAGPVIEYDSRDRQYWPRHGSYARFEANFASNTTGTRGGGSYQAYDGFYNGYSEINENSVIAYRGSFCAVSDHSPFFDLCTYGNNNDLRGYSPGQYRDKTSFALQAEYRWQFFHRFGLVAFGGVGGVAPDFGDYRLKSLLPAAGAGLRYRVLEDDQLNIGIDVAAGKHSSEYYFRIGEAF
jgi:outer membrane protein assembly factor BamA